MGFTPNSSPKGGPTFNNSPQTTADLNEERRFAEERGNGMVGPGSDRTDVTGAALYEGLTFYETDTKRTYQVQGGTWVLIAEDTGWITPTTEFATGWAPFTDTVWSGFRYRRKNGVVTIIGAASKSSYAGLERIMTLPTGFRPVVTALSGSSNSGLYAVVRSDGQILTSASGSGRVPITVSFPV